MKKIPNPHRHPEFFEAEGVRPTLAVLLILIGNTNVALRPRQEPVLLSDPSLVFPGQFRRSDITTGILCLNDVYRSLLDLNKQPSQVFSDDPE